MSIRADSKLNWRQALVRGPALLALIATTLGAADFYVSPTGSDSNPGTKRKPFATLERAREALRGARSPGGTVYLRGGDYLRTNTLELTAADSGTVGAPMTWQAEKGETARLLGGRVLVGFHPLTDAAVRERLSEPARAHVVEVDLRARGIADFGEMKSRGFSRPTSPSHVELFYNRKPMTLARWPNEGEFERIDGYPDSGAHQDEHGGNLGELKEGFLYSGDRPRNWRNPAEAWVHGYWAWDWANSYEHVVSIDPEKKLVRTAPPYGNYGFRKGQRFYFLNVLEELDQPGEWFIERASGRLYFWPPGEVDGTNEVLISLLAGPLVRAEGASQITLRNLTLEAGRGSGVIFHGGTSNRVADCVLRNLGNCGVVVEGGKGHGVIGCDVFDTGDGGVVLDGGSRPSLQAGGHYVSNCHFARQGRWSKCYVPAILMSGVGQRVDHNLIHDHPHCAILYTGNDHQIEFNEIHHIALETGDVGAIYSGRDYTYRGNRIRWNYIHHTGGVGMGSMGVYMDDCVSGAEIYGNVFYQVQRAAFLGGGRDHRVVNNIFVDCNHAVELDGRGLDKSPVWHDMVDKFMRDRLNDVPLSVYRQCYPELKSLDSYYGPPGGQAITGDAFHGVPPDGNIVARNVCVGKWLNVYWHADKSMLRLENNLTNALSSFGKPPTDTARATDFALNPDSPAWKLGFERIPLEEIGLQRAGRNR